MCVLPETVFSQWKLLSSNLDNIGITAICANENVWLAGEHYKDVLWFSTDRGKSWKTIDKGDKQFTYGYKTIVNNNGKIVAGILDGDRGYWGTYENSGQKRIGGGTASQSINVISYPNNEWLRIEYGVILRSIDGGITWQSEQPNLIPNTAFFPYAAIEKNGILYIGGYPIAMVSTNKGKNFQLMDLPAEKGGFNNFTICNDRLIGVFSKSTTEKNDVKIYSSPLGIKPNWTLQNDLSDRGFDEIWRFEGYQNHLFGINLTSTFPTNLFYSNDLGKTITPISNGLNTSTYPFCLQVLGDTVLLGTSKGLYWTKLSEINKAIVLSNESIIDTEVLIYPNPTDGYLMIECLQKMVKIEMVDLMGKTQSIDFKKIAENKLQLNTEKLLNGVYSIQINYQNQSKKIKKVMVSHE